MDWQYYRALISRNGMKSTKTNP